MNKRLKTLNVSACSVVPNSCNPARFCGRLQSNNGAIFQVGLTSSGVYCKLACQSHPTVSFSCVQNTVCLLLHNKSKGVYHLYKMNKPKIPIVQSGHDWNIGWSCDLCELIWDAGCTQPVSNAVDFRSRRLRYAANRSNNITNGSSRSCRIKSIEHILGSTSMACRPFLESSLAGSLLVQRHRTGIWIAQSALAKMTSMRAYPPSNSSTSSSLHSRHMSEALNQNDEEGKVKATLKSATDTFQYGDDACSLNPCMVG